MVLAKLTSSEPPLAQRLRDQLAGINKPMPTTAKSPPQAAHPMCPVMKLPGRMLIP
jgi:hypothetical protein